MSVLFISSHHFCGHPPWRLSVLFCRRLCASLCVFLGLSGPLCASLCFSQALWASLGLSGTLRASLGLCRPLWASLGLSNKNKTIHNQHTYSWRPSFPWGPKLPDEKTTQYVPDSWSPCVLRGPKLQDKKTRQYPTVVAPAFLQA